MDGNNTRDREGYGGGGPPGVAESVWRAALSRVGRWRTPPRWSARDWREEVAAVMTAVACAIRAGSPTVAGDGRTYWNLVSAARTRHRQEWAFGRRYADGPYLDRAEWPASRLNTEADFICREALDGLTEPDRALITRLVIQGRCAAAIAREEGVTQQAISKRKARILKTLRRSPALAALALEDFRL
jgi:hypothetical protein